MALFCAAFIYELEEEYIQFKATLQSLFHLGYREK